MKNLKFLVTLLATLLFTTVPQSFADTFYGDINTKTQHPEWMDNAVIYEVNLRQGSDARTINGFSHELPRLKTLGVDIIWLMPVHPISELNRKGELGSYYAVKDYKAINPEFGTFEDFKKFVKKAHALGMKVIIDEVCNHSGCDNTWVTENPDFYAKDSDGKMFGPFDWTDTYKLDYSNPDMRRAMIDALKFWVKEADIDGYRCDVAMHVPTDFWEETRVELQKIKPVFMLAEASKPELTLAAFDADYNWPMKDLFNAIAATHGANDYAVTHNQELPHATATDIDSLLSLQKRQYPHGASQMNMITNHDLNSWEGTEFERLGPAVGAFAVLSYTLPGIPMLYTGQEVGFNHAFEFFRHDTVPDYTRNEFTTFYELLNSLKHSQRALDTGNQPGIMTRFATANTDIYAFERTKGNCRVVVITNLSNKPADVNFLTDSPDISGLKDWFTCAEATIPTTLNPWEFRVFTAK